MTKRATHRKYFSTAVFCLLTSWIVAFYGCKQTAHIEKNKHNFEPKANDTTVTAPPPKPIRITDTITIVVDSISADTTIQFVTDSIAVADSLFVPDSLHSILDTIHPLDSIQPDTLQKPSDTINKILPKRSSSAIETQVICSANDSVYRDMDQKKVFYYGNAEAKYDDITLKADYLEFDLETSVCKAKGTLDSLGKLQGRPVFTQGQSTFEAEEMSYNFKSKKGVITKVWTEESGGYLHGERVKRMDDNTINIRSGGYTTCNLKDHPHYQFRFKKAKVIPDDKIVTGPIYMTVSDVPVPLALPFAIIPNTKGKKSGLIIPTYGESANRGFYFENGGYYWAISDYYDLRVLGDIYTRGSWGIKPTFRYNKRYKFNGSIDLGFAVNKIGTKGAADYEESNDFKIQWIHKQDQKSHPRRNFSANVNIVSTNFNKYNATTTTEQLSNTFKSSIAYQTNFSGKVYLTLNASHSQNTMTRQVTASLPELTLTVNRFYPLKKVGKVGKKRWYQEMNVGYTMNGKIYINEIDTVLFKGFSDNFGDWLQDVARNHAMTGVKHNIPINLPIKLFKHFTWTNSVNFNDYMYFTHLEKQWVHDTDSTGHLQTDTIHGFRNLVDFNLSSNLTTKLYGMLRFAKGPIRAIRHVVTPTVGFTYKPNFGDPKWNIYDTFVDGNGKEQTYNKFANGIFGSPSQNKSGLITYSFNNTLDMKVPSRTDTITGLKNITLLESFGLSGNYDVTKDSLRFSTLGINARTTLFKKLRINYNSVWDPYACDSLGRRINKFEIFESGRLFHKNSSSWNFSLSYSLNQNELKKWRGDKDTDDKNPNSKRDEINNQAMLSGAFDPDELHEIMGNPNAYVDWTTPWSLTFSYNLSYTSNITYAAIMGVAANRVVQTLNLNGDISLTPKWKFTFSTGWDFTNHGLSYTNISVYRDLHCWEMRFNWIPTGSYKSWNFTINVKAQTLKDLKYTKKKDYRDN